MNNRSFISRWLLLLLCIYSSLLANATIDSINQKNKWFDEYPKHVGFSWSASATFTSNYIWRGLYCGGPSMQLDATVDYGGFFANVWWNVGTTGWTFSEFNPEVDISIGFKRWGVSVYYIHIYYFDRYIDGTRSHFFDFKNYPKGGGGTTGEWRVGYRVSDRLPLSVLVGVRTFSRDGYEEVVKNNIYPTGVELKRAYSTYIELGYDFYLGENWQLDARLGFTPAKSLYTGFQGNFAVTLVGLKLHKSWVLNIENGNGKAAVVNVFANVMLCPWQLTKDNLIRPIAEAGNQKLNMAVGCSIGL